MPRKWSNSFGGNGGGNVKHQFTPPTPARTYNAKGFPVDLRIIDQILAANAKAASKENKFSKGR